MSHLHRWSGLPIRLQSRVGVIKTTNLPLEADIAHNTVCNQWGQVSYLRLNKLDSLLYDPKTASST
ncbi:TPA: hypothetical protein PXJ64_001478 [Yersinia enterocolitica]|nr:hypothetical protein [Yersinia enterocolitica]HDL6715412.1 hypothetical protein [Yersinia enterocolitica]HEI6977498.1 hypothetical protein [Yersinia enterocolitica]